MEKKRIDGWTVWEITDSSRVTKIEFKPTSDLLGELRVTFKSNGSRYIYHDVPKIFVTQVIKSTSIGKALGIIIKNKSIKYEKLED